ncbi:hypothetical protein Mapa_014087 [Marchantia paleacea]|nr:hypothetical protein Mapa_014087 [Marchantia paleacea]
MALYTFQMDVHGSDKNREARSIIAWRIRKEGHRFVARNHYLADKLLRSTVFFSDDSLRSCDVL